MHILAPRRDLWPTFHFTSVVSRVKADATRADVELAVISRHGHDQIPMDHVLSLTERGETLIVVAASPERPFDQARLNPGEKELRRRLCMGGRPHEFVDPSERSLRQAVWSCKRQSPPEPALPARFLTAVQIVRILRDGRKWIANDADRLSSESWLYTSDMHGHNGVDLELQPFLSETIQLLTSCGIVLSEPAGRRRLPGGRRARVTKLALTGPPKSDTRAVIELICTRGEFPTRMKGLVDALLWGPMKASGLVKPDIILGP